MDQNQLFVLASAEDKRLEIGIDFRRGGTFPCPECGAAGCKAYDTEQREWRHLNFFQHQTILRARVPRIDRTDAAYGR